MPLKHHDPFATQINNLNPEINPYVALMLQGMERGSLPVACGPMLKECRGSWREKISSFYGHAQPFKKLVVEIGCHKGHVLCQMAADNPGTAFIGIDITYKRVVGTAERALKLGLKNVFTVLANAKSIDLIFASGEVDGTLIFFPDPWVKKKRQAKNKLVDQEFSIKLASVLRPGAFCWFKTDQEPYFLEADHAFGTAGFAGLTKLCSITGKHYPSVFEQRFAEQKLPTFASKWLRSSVLSSLPSAVE